MVHQRQRLALGLEPGHTCLVSMPSLMILSATRRPLTPTSRPLNQNPTHRLRRCRKKMPATVPRLRSPSNQPQIGLVHQRRCLQRLAPLFLRHPISGQRTQLIVNERDELLRRLGVPGLDRVEYASYFFHR
jgi:hypothetical protein